VYYKEGMVSMGDGSDGQVADMDVTDQFDLCSPEKWAVFVEEQVVKARRWVGKQIRDPVEAEDIVQDAFIISFNALRAKKIETNPAGFLWGTIRRTLMSRRKRLAREAQLRVRLDDSVLQLFPDKSCSAADAASREQLLCDVERVIAELPEGDQDILDSRFYGGESFPQIGNRLGISSDAAYKRYLRAIERVRAHFKQRATAGEMNDELQLYLGGRTA
jgi:RNA polymerase sigma factor (sigma-70 family)